MTSRRLADYERRYRELAGELAQLGFISSGSVVHRYTRCGTDGCRCHDDPPERHGPYWQWTEKLNGKTVTKRLSPEQAELYRQWIANDRRMRKLIAQMRTVAKKAEDVLLSQA